MIIAVRCSARWFWRADTDILTLRICWWVRTGLLRYAYSLLFYLLLPFIVARLLWRSRAEPLYRDAMGERFGYVRPSTNGPVWVHAVSAGEVNAAAPMIQRLLDADCAVVTTTMTPTGRGRVKALFGDRVVHIYAPYDFPGAVHRFLDRIRPCLLIIIDTELWPNILAGAGGRGIPVLLVNARLSARSARRYARIGPLVREMFSHLSCVACQTYSQGKRFTQLGLRPDKLLVAGSIKFDIELPVEREASVSRIRDKLAGRRVILGASTHPGEESALLDVMARIDDLQALLVLAPRHPNRNDDVEALCKARGLATIRHSTGAPCSERTQVLLLDTMGELLYFYEVAELAFVGGSLVPVGGHNPMEPAVAGVPFVMGPYLHNIDEIAGRFSESGAMRVAATAAELVEVMKELYANAEARRLMVDNARRVMDENRGALDRVMAVITEKLGVKSSGD